MRRDYIDFSYKQRTEDIIRSVYQPWQSIYRDNMDPVHSMINRLGSITHELEHEIEYVENMYFPDKFDINEEWLIYEIDTHITAAEVYLSGSPITEVLTRASSIDEFIAGQYGHFDILESGDTSFNVNHATVCGENIVYLSDNKAIKHNLISGSETEYVLYSITSGEVSVFVNADNPDIGFNIELMKDDITVTYESSTLPVEYYERSAINIEYKSEYDINSDNIINRHELNELMHIVGKSKVDVEPEEWEAIKWADFNNNGSIDNEDYEYIKNYIPSMSPMYQSIITLPSGVAGSVNIKYSEKYTPVKLLISINNDYDVLSESHDISSICDRVAYEKDTSILYGINYYLNEVYAISVERGSYNLNSKSRLFINTGGEKHTFIDLAVHIGFLYVLTEYEGSYYIFYGDILKEFTEYIDKSAVVDIPGTIELTGLLIDTTGSFYVYNETTTYKLKAHRDRYIEMNDTVYTNIKYPLTDANGNSLKILPWNIFNSFDSFAFSFGIERPAGCDNTQMKRLIYDIFKHRQGNDRIGINYGIKRELGIVNDYNSFESITYTLPERLITSGGVYIDGYEMSVTTSGGYEILSGSPGIFKLSGYTTFIPGDDVYDNYSIINLSGTFLDGNNDMIFIDYTIPLMDKHTWPDIEVYSLSDPLYKTSGRYPYSDTEIIEMVREYEDNEPFAYKNIVTNVYPTDGFRISAIPVIATKYNPVINLSGEETISI